MLPGRSKPTCWSSYRVSGMVKEHRVQTKHMVARLALQPKSISPNVPEIPGFSCIFASDQNQSRRRFWICVLLISGVLMFMNIRERVYYFMNTDPLVTVSTKKNNTLQFPAVTICPVALNENPSIENLTLRKLNASSSISHVFQLIDLEDVSIESLWTETDSYFHLYFHEIVVSRTLVSGIRYMGNNSLQLMTLSSATGQCKVLYSDESVPDYNTLYDMRLKLLSVFNGRIFDAVYIHVHPLEDINESKYFHIHTGIFVRFGSAAFLTYETLVYISENRLQQRCDESAKVIYCEKTCLMNLFKRNQNITCSLPFMMLELQLPVFNTSSESLTTYVAVSSIIEGFNRSKCECPIKCERVEFKLKYMNSNKYPDPHGMELFFILDHQITTFTEYWPFSFNGLLSDIGGNLGLFLGTCVVSLVQIIEYMILWTRKRLLK